MLAASLLLVILPWQLVAAFTLPRLPWQTFLQPRLATFILDLKHPWIHNNTLSLRLLPDPTQALCNSSSSIRQASEVELFQYLEIDNKKYDVDRPGWINARARIREILACPAALQEVESFKVEVWTESKPPEDVPALFVKALSAMPNLRRLEWQLYSWHKDFEQAFSDLQLPAVRYLRMAVQSSSLLQSCPGVEDLYATRRYDRLPEEAYVQVVNFTRGLENLTRFGMDSWEIHYLETLHVLHPSLESISIDGELVPSWYHKESALENYLDVLARFKRLRALRLPYPAGLGFAFDGGPWCGNAYMGRGGRVTYRQVERDGIKTAELAARRVLHRLPQLDALDIGGYPANIRLENGTTTLTWPWTEMGMQKWTYTQWPDLKEGNWEEW